MRAPADLAPPVSSRNRIGHVMPPSQPNILPRRPMLPIRPASAPSEAPAFDAQEVSKLILAASRDCVVVLSSAGNTLYVSPGGIESMEIANIEEVLGTSWLRVWRNGDLAAAQNAVAVARSGGIGRFQGFCPTHQGKPKWWDVMISPLTRPDGAHPQLVSVGRDITEQKVARDSLAVSEDTLRLATEAGGIGTWSLDLLTGVLTPSEHIKVTAGSDTPGPYTLDDFYARIHPEDRPATVAAFESARDPLRRATYDVEYRLKVPAGAPRRWVAAKGRGTFDHAGRCIRVTGTLIDITARRAADARLRASELALREINMTIERRVEERSRERDHGLNVRRKL